jgi:hypothetical protein
MDKYFLDKTPQDPQNKSKNRQIGLHILKASAQQRKSLPEWRENLQGGKVFTNYTWQGVNI